MKQKILLIGVTYTRMNTIIVYYITKQELECGNTISPFVSVIFNTNQNDAIIIYFTQIGMEKVALLRFERLPDGKKD